MYVFNKITVNPQLPKRIDKLSTIANNLWWSWNSEFLKLFKMIDIDLWESIGKNPVKFLKLVSQDKLEECSKALEEELKKVTINRKQSKVVKNIDGKIYTDSDDAVDILSRHIISPVRFTLCLQNMYDNGVDIFVEIGPRKDIEWICEEDGI